MITIINNSLILVGVPSYWQREWSAASSCPARACRFSQRGCGCSLPAGSGKFATPKK
jgi:hypothetical protein